MGKLDMAGFAKTVRATLSKHSPTILTTIGIIGMASTVVEVAKATPKALVLIEVETLERRADEYDMSVELTPLEIVKICWKCYVPAALTFAASTACIVGANGVHTRRNAALATAYKISEAALSEYKDAVIETVGEKKERTIREKMAENSLKKHPVDEERIQNTGHGNTLCHDAVFGSYFRSSREVIDRAIVEVNRKIVSGDMYASLNDFYDEVGIEHIDIGDLLGWNLDDGEIVIDIDYGGAHNGEPTLVIRYNVNPKYDFYKFV